MHFKLLLFASVEYWLKMKLHSKIQFCCVRLQVFIIKSFNVRKLAEFCMESSQSSFHFYFFDIFGSSETCCLPGYTGRERGSSYTLLNWALTLASCLRFASICVGIPVHILVFIYTIWWTWKVATPGGAVVWMSLEHVCVQVSSVRWKEEGRRIIHFCNYLSSFSVNWYVYF